MARAQVTCDKSDNFKASFVSVLKFQHMIQRGEVNKTSEAKHTKAFWMKNILKQTIQKLLVTMPKRMIVTTQKRLKDISNTDKEIYE